MGMLKQCCRCGLHKPLDCFYPKTANRVDGHTYACIPCSNELTRAYYDAHAEQQKAKARSRYHANKEAYNAARRAARKAKQQGEAS
jgi:hypothetical protein